MTDLPPLPPYGVNPTHNARQLRAYARAYGAACAAQEREACIEAVKSVHWMQRVKGRWTEADVEWATGYQKAKVEAVAAIRARETP